tara:strand:- start:1216 stop:2046 length:831 start_codon:yes stop_codon:yes gene_type:complete
MNNKSYIFIFIILFLLSCTRNNKKDVVASVGDKKLFLNDILSEIPGNQSDSSFFVRQYINQWIKKELLVYHAKINLISSQDYEKQVEDYRSSLLIHEYQQQLINQHFDTAISSESIKSYYNQYKNQFKLVKNIFQGRYIKIDKKAPKLSFLSNYYTSNNEEIVLDLEDYCQQFAKEYYFFDSTWTFFSFVNDKIPLKIIKEEHFLINNKNIYFEDEQYRYYLYIKDYKIKGSTSPLSMEKEKIKNVLLNKNKVAYLKEFQNELYQNGLDLKMIKIY